MNKSCPKCESDLPVECFTKDKSRADGLSNYCRSCKAKAKAIYREKNADKIKAYESEYSQRESVKERRRAYQREYEKLPKRKEKNRLMRQKHAHKYKARRKVEYALSIGKLVKGACSVCGSCDNIQGHHEDYDKPLEVVWMCQPCHMKHHASI